MMPHDRAQREAGKLPRGLLVGICFFMWWKAARMEGADQGESTRDMGWKCGWKRLVPPAVFGRAGTASPRHRILPGLSFSPREPNQIADEYPLLPLIETVGQAFCPPALIPHCTNPPGTAVVFPCLAVHLNAPVRLPVDFSWRSRQVLC